MAWAPGRATSIHRRCAPEIDAINTRVYETLNNGVYRAGFSRRQDDYERTVGTLFDTLDWLEAMLSRNRYLLGDEMTEADIRLFVTLVRFDSVYHGLFKCNLRTLTSFPALWRFNSRHLPAPGHTPDSAPRPHQGPLLPKPAGG